MGDNRKDKDEVLDGLAERVVALAQALGGDLHRIRLEADGETVEVEWYPPQMRRLVTPPGVAVPAAAAVASASVGEAVSTGNGHAAAPAAEPVAVDERLVPVTAPVVGTFYRAAQPGGPPFVVEGDSVEEGQTVAIVEAMKIMNQIAAPVAGRVARVAAPDGEIVEFDQPLLYLEPV